MRSRAGINSWHYRGRNLQFSRGQKDIVTMNIREEFRFRVKQFQMRSDLKAVSNAHISSDRGCEHDPPHVKVYLRNDSPPLFRSFFCITFTRDFGNDFEGTTSNPLVMNGGVKKSRAIFVGKASIWEEKIHRSFAL